MVKFPSNPGFMVFPETNRIDVYDHRDFNLAKELAQAYKKAEPEGKIWRVKKYYK